MNCIAKKPAAAVFFCCELCGLVGAPQYIKIGGVVFEVPINAKTGQAQIRTVFPSKEPR